VEPETHRDLLRDPLRLNRLRVLLPALGAVLSAGLAIAVVDTSGQPWWHVAVVAIGAMVGFAALWVLVEGAISILLLAAAALIAACFWPGHMNADTLNQISEVQSGNLTNQFAPVISAIWHQFHEIGAGPGWVLTAQLVAFLAGSYIVLRVAFGTLTAAIVAILVTLSPPVFGQIGLLGRDTWFVAILVLTFGLTIRAANSQARERVVFAVLAMVGAWLAIATRPNAMPGVVLVLIVIAALGLAAWKARRPASRAFSTDRRLVAAATVVGIAATLALMGVNVAASAALHARDINPEQGIAIYDLAAISHRERKNLFPPEVMPERGMRPVDASWNPDSNIAYVVGPTASIQLYLPPDKVRTLTDSWFDAVTKYPGTYLAERWTLFLRQIGVTRKANVAYHPGIDGNPFGYRIRFDDLNEAATDYLDLFAEEDLEGGRVYTIWIYLALGLAGSFVLLIQRDSTPALRAVGAFGLTILTYQSGLFIGAPATQYRYEFPMVAVAMLVSIVAAKRLIDVRRGRRYATLRTGGNADRPGLGDSRDDELVGEQRGPEATNRVG
jgi:hypothetical protein